jgi:hypothetical protein
MKLERKNEHYVTKLYGAVLFNWTKYYNYTMYYVPLTYSS